MNYPLLNIFFTTMWVFRGIMWFFLLFRVFGDLFRDDSVGGWAKAGWTVFVLVLPFLGVFVYLIARGKGMGEREYKRSQEAEAAFRSYIQEASAGADTAAAPSGQVAELTRLADLKQTGALSDEEYERAKSKVLAA